MLKLSLFCVLIVWTCLLATAEGQERDCPDGTPTVNCFVAPCSLDRPEGCPRDARCEDDYCGGCNRHFYDSVGNEICNECENDTLCGPQIEMARIECPDGSVGGNTGRCIKTSAGNCKWETRRCPSNCSGVMCALYCQYGFQTDASGCPICQCRPPPVCLAVLCPMIHCDYDATLNRGDECCPRCVQPCEAVTCPQIRCAPGFRPYTPPGECCATCVPIPDCTAAFCQTTMPVCDEGKSPVLHDCCYRCEPNDCSNVACLAVVCQPNEKTVIADGGCCPRCEPVPDCSAVDCAAFSCPAGHELVPTDLDCCGQCREPIDCRAVLCAQPRCHPYSWIRRTGSCCYQCPLCIDSDKKVCNTNDDKECRGGYWKGTECTDRVPDDQRRSVTLNVKYCGKNCEELDPQVIRLYVANKANVPAKHITVNVLGKADDGCCVNYEIVIAAEAGSFDVDAAEPVVATALASDPSFTVETSTNDSNLLKSSFALLAVLLLLV